MGRIWKNNSLTIVLMTMFAISLIGQALTGWTSDGADRRLHGAVVLGLWSYLASGEFLSVLFENWESEFLQMAVYVVLTAFLIQKGSSESKDPDGPDGEAEAARATPAARQPRLARAKGLIRALYDRSLGIALSLLFVLSFVLHWLNSARMEADEALMHGGAPEGVWGRLADPAFWFESFQNWQSEFLSTAVLVVLSIYLRQKGSPESKPVAAPHSQTGR